LIESLIKPKKKSWPVGICGTTTLMVFSETIRDAHKNMVLQMQLVMSIETK
jgi:hypothetical protein